VYLYALVDRTGKNDLSQLRSLQDWFLKYELKTVPGVSEVAASVVEMAEAEYMVRATGYIQSIEDLEVIPLGVNQNGTPLLLKDVADIGIGPQMRRGVAELDSEGELVGGVVVMRFGENAQTTINGVKAKLESLKKSLPDGVEVVAVISLPVGILTAFIIMHWQGLNANIMSLAGIAIAIGAMVDGAIVMIENMHKHMERTPLTDENRWQVVATAASEVGPALFFSLLITTVSFLPVFALEAQEGRMFSPLAFTKTYAMAASAILAITLVPVLMGYFIRGKVIPERKNPLNRLLAPVYMPALRGVLRFPKTTLVGAVLVLAIGAWPLNKIGSEFIPDLDEGDLMYMPTTYPGVSTDVARQILQQTNKLIRTVPEVVTVFGKVGRAEMATDPAPLSMIETFIQLKPKSEWHEGMTTAKLKQELDQLVRLPGVTNAWVMPIKTRIDMLATGIKTPVGIKVAGPDLNIIQGIGQQLEKVLKDVEGTASVYSERVAGGRYIKVDIQREKAARYGLNIGDIQEILASAVGGMNVSSTVEGLERYLINVRYPQDYRDSPKKLELLPIVTPAGLRIALGDVANIFVENGPPMLKSENARLNGWTYIDIAGEDLDRYVENAQQVVAEQVGLPPGYSLNWSGHYEYMLRAKEKLTYVVPLTLAIIVVLLFLNFRNFIYMAMIMGTLPLALVGSIWLMYW
jgi:Cu(I)/Ag(I) efflux system membrane protein CusA/SilA